MNRRVIGGWLRFAGVTFAAIDGDNQHQTLARRYPNDVEIVKLFAQHGFLDTITSCVDARGNDVGM
jgi:hypothetical protein